MRYCPSVPTVVGYRRQLFRFFHDSHVHTSFLELLPTCWSNHMVSSSFILWLVSSLLLSVFIFLFFSLSLSLSFSLFFSVDSAICLAPSFLRSYLTSTSPSRFTFTSISLVATYYILVPLHASETPILHLALIAGALVPSTTPTTNHFNLRPINLDIPEWGSLSIFRCTRVNREFYLSAAFSPRIPLARC